MMEQYIYIYIQVYIPQNAPQISIPRHAKISFNLADLGVSVGVATYEIYPKLGFRP